MKYKSVFRVNKIHQRNYDMENKHKQKKLYNPSSSCTLLKY